MAERTKQLSLAKTVIGTYEYKNRTYNVLYGGIFDVHQTGGQIVNLDKDEYSSMLTDFLLSEEGQEYLIPNQTQIVSDRDTLTRAEEVKKILKPYREEKQEVNASKAMENLKIEIPQEDKDLCEKLNLKEKFINLFPEDNTHIKKLENYGKLFTVFAYICIVLGVIAGVCVGVFTGNIVTALVCVVVGVTAFFPLRVSALGLIADAKMEDSSIENVRVKVTKII